MALPNIVTEIKVLQKLESEWHSTNPVIPNGVGAYSIDTRLMRVGNGTQTWSDLTFFTPAAFVGPHSFAHEPGGYDAIDIYKFINKPYVLSAHQYSSVVAEANSVATCLFTINHQTEPGLFTHSNGVFTYNGTVERTFMIDNRFLFERDDTSEEAMYKSYTIEFSITTNRENPVYSTNSVVYMGIGDTIVSSNLTRLITLKRNDTLTFTFSPAIKTKVATNISDQNCAMLYIHSVD